MADEKIPEAALMVLVRETTTKHAEEIMEELGPGTHVVVMVGKDTPEHSCNYWCWKGTCNQVVGLFYRTKKSIDQI